MLNSPEVDIFHDAYESEQDQQQKIQNHYNHKQSSDQLVPHKENEKKVKVKNSNKIQLTTINECDLDDDGETQSCLEKKSQSQGNFFSSSSDFESKSLEDQSTGRKSSSLKEQSYSIPSEQLFSNKVKVNTSRKDSIQLKCLSKIQQGQFSVGKASWVAKFSYNGAALAVGGSDGALRL